MQYLLTQEEYNELLELRELTRKMPRLDELQKHCTHIADTLPIVWRWKHDQSKAEPWECILTSEDEHYCDECPVQKICPHPRKSWSK